MGKRIYIAFLALVFAIFLIPSSVLAASDNFYTDYDVTYTVRDDATTHVNFDIKLTNKTSQYYASSYTLLLGFKNSENVKVKDEGGEITPNIATTNDGSNIELNFNKRIVGYQNTLNFNLSLDTKDIVQKSGRIWDINIPGVSQQNDFRSFNVHIKVPPFLGKPTYIKPNVKGFATSDLNFTKEDLGKSGISISFGSEQIYKFNLSYHLKNSNLFPIKTEVALPPTTNYQDVKIDEIIPRPINVLKDTDGNWLAQYKLSPRQKVNVKVLGSVKIVLNPKPEPLSQEELLEYLKEQPYWQISSVKIKSLANTLKTPAAIYEYIVKNLTYDFSRVTLRKPRAGALEVLKNPRSAVCLEFTDLFIAIARAAGIPSREVNGFAFTQNQKERPLSLVKDVLHAWPQYYDQNQKTWVMVDPTWGNTTGGVDYFHTLDFDHFAFVIKGKNSNYPIPAGGYKYEEDLASKDVNVEIADTFLGLNQDLSIGENFSKSYFSGSKIASTLTVRNIGNTPSSPKTVVVNTNFLTPKYQEIHIDSIPPYGFLTIPISFAKPSFLTNKTDTITIAVDGNSITKKVKISPLFFLSFIAERIGHLPFFGR